MSHFHPDTRVAVTPFAHRHEGQDVTIGDLEREVFVTIPREGLEVLAALAAGMTVAEAARQYEQRHGETPDLEDFLCALELQGFVTPWSDLSTRPEPQPAPAHSLPDVPSTFAARVLGAPALAVATVAVGFALVVLATDPGLLPGPRVLVFRRHLAVLLSALLATNLTVTIVHELAHLLAARASGIPARIRISHRLWFVVFETEMTGIWMAPKRSRYLAFLAGPIFDAAFASSLIGVLWAERHAWIGLSQTAKQFIGASLFCCLMQLLWQCFVFVRTDFYYVLTTALGCKNLLGDTEDLLRNWLSRVRGSGRMVDQSAIPPAEMRAVRAYSVVWLVGRGLALASLVLVTFPVFARYGELLVQAARGHSTYGTADLSTLLAVDVGLPAAGLYLWIRGLYKQRKERNGNELAAD